MRPAGPGLDDFVAGHDYPVFVVTAASGDERDGRLVGFSTQTTCSHPWASMRPRTRTATPCLQDVADIEAGHSA